jgi:hypothetical protein
MRHSPPVGGLVRGLLCIGISSLYVLSYLVICCYGKGFLYVEPPEETY